MWFYCDLGRDLLDVNRFVFGAAVYGVLQLTYGHGWLHTECQPWGDGYQGDDYNRDV